MILKKISFVFSGICLLLLLASCTAEAPDLSTGSIPMDASDKGTEIEDDLNETTNLTKLADQKVMDVSTLKQILQSGIFTRKDLTNQIGKDYKIISYNKYIDGKQVPWVVWRYDFAREDYIYRPLEGKGTDYPDFAGLRSGVVSMQLFIKWGERDEGFNYILYYQGLDGEIHSDLGFYRTSENDSFKHYSSQDNELAQKYDIQLGQMYAVQKNFTAYEQPIESQTSRTAFFTAKDEKYEVTAITEYSVRIMKSNGLRGWIPTWYLTGESQRVKLVEPMKTLVQEDTPFSIHPGGSVIGEIPKDRVVYLFEQYEDWYGVVDPEQKGKYGGMYWVRHQALQPLESMEPLYDQMQNVNYDIIESVVQGQLRLEAAKDRMLEIFGEPAFTEESRNIHFTGEPLKTLEVWRYENETSELVITWTDNDKVYDFYFLLPEKKLTTSLEPNIDWRFKSDLAFNYLAGISGNTLVVKGDDGGFSGMHDNSNLYGLDEQTGHKLWQIDAGWERIQYYLYKNFIAVLTRVDGEKREYAPRLQVLEPSTEPSFGRSNGTTTGNGVI
jgi:hypothetical protein